MKNLLILSGLLLSTGCATVTNGLNQEIDFKQHLERTGAAQCTVTCDKKEIGVVSLETPVLEVRRSSKGLEVKCGVETIFYTSHINTAGKVGMILVDGGLVDFATGALWEYEVEEKKDEKLAVK